DFNQIRYLPINEGRWLNELDNAQKRAVVVIGDEARRVLFPGWPAIGQTILMNGTRFQVIGTLKRVGHGENNTKNLQIYMPFSVMHEDFPPLNVGEIDDAISFINYQPVTRDKHETAREEVHQVLGRNHGFDPSNPDSFDEWDTIKTVDAIGKIFDAMNMFLGSVGLVTLGLGAIGIINIMLVAVADRTREIGLRKALGATNSSILFQFFAEGAFLTLISGGIGMGCAAGFMALLGLLPQPQGFGGAIQNIWESFGATAVGIYPGRTSQQAGGNKAGMAVRFTNEDIEVLRNVVPLARHVSRVAHMEGTNVQNGNRTFQLQTTGIDPAMADIWALSIDQGRFLDAGDNLSHAYNV